MDNTAVIKLARWFLNLYHKSAEGFFALPDVYIYLSQYFSSEIDSNPTAPQHKATTDLQAEVLLRHDIHHKKKTIPRINRTVNKSINCKNI